MFILDPIWRDQAHRLAGPHPTRASEPSRSTISAPSPGRGAP
jgi:hypothetical protein